MNKEMSGTKNAIRIRTYDAQYLWLILILVLASLRCIWCAEGDIGGKAGDDNPLLEEFAKSLFKSQLSNLTKLLDKEFSTTLGFCITNMTIEVNSAFNYSDNMDFGAECVKETPDAMLRLCTAAEMEFYFASFINHVSSDAQFMKPNRNCNLTSWLPGCEPGWACRTSDNKKPDFNNHKDIPDRTALSKPCCEGFYCPRGLTCMIPCPKGSYCPRAKFNTTTGICDPYHYQLPPGKPNHTCGGADIWASSMSSHEMFCSAGSFCPTTITRVPCSEGHYCQMGSSDQKECSMLSTCNPNTEKQNLHANAVLLIGVLSFMLIIFYNCFDQVLTTRYERQAKSRERAAKIARETVQARARWKLAKNAARSNSTGLKQQVSRTISRRKSGWGPEKQKDLDQPNTSTSGASLPPDTSKSKIPLPPSAAPNAKRKESNLTKMMQSIENDPESYEGIHLQIGDKNLKKQKPKNAELHTRSQILKYAYGQLEEEKALEQKRQKLTFSGVIRMAADSETRKRPTIEVAFKNLTITLKGKNKHLLRSVTGKILPGRISAVMGPSGAGKTTFISAVMGKITGCNLTGSILVNGRAEPIQSYKKIIGFVPQDDIVHGNLTVEENLRFSARCRLPADMPKADRVLVVERVIESLGLQAIRESLVGTVEKRGISGGQRKRVNVGLEMVMEPSLLILDEPTSGLDSASSNLLLKALRREALEGVNICMVVHQPSYTLYKMFHDLILLAKGGLIVYQGPVDKVEEYFAGMGITVPDRVNPPDHLIDILEGMIKPSGGVTAQQLPVRWMLHNEYPVPPDMLELINDVGTFSKPPEQNFSGDSWHEKQDHVPQKSLISHDLSNRTTVSIIRQYRYFLGRVSKQRLREAKTQAADYLILLLAGACLGILSDNKDDVVGYFGYMYTVISVSLLCKISALRSFSLDKLHSKRERDGGMSILASFLSKDTIDHFNTIVKPVVFLSMFYFLSSPRSTFAYNYLVLLCLVYCVTGIAYIFAICLEPGPAQLWCVLVPVVMTLIANQEGKENISMYLADFCYPKWAMEAFVTANAKEFGGVWLITRCGALMKLGYSVHNATRSLLLLVLTGVVSRLLAYLCLVTIAKK